MASHKIANRSQQFISILIVLGFIAVANYLLTRVFFRIDLTDGKVYSISNATKKIIGELDDIVNIKVVFSEKLPPNMMPVRADVKDLLTEYETFSNGKLRITWWDPGTSDEDKQSARGLGVQEVQMQTIEKDQAQVMMGYLGIAVMFADKKEVLPMVVDHMSMKLKSNFEYDLTQAIMKVTRTEAPKVAIIKTDTAAFIPPSVRRQMQIPGGDDTEEKYKPIFENLRETYDVELVDIAEGQKIDPKFRTAIIPGGVRFSKRQLYEIDQFFMNGGNLIVLSDAISISFQYGPAASVQRTELMDLLEHYGARIGSDMVLDAVCGSVQIPQKFGMFQMNVQKPYPYFVQLVQEGFNTNIPAVSSLGEVIIPWASSITFMSDETDTTSGAQNDKIKVRGHNAYATIIATSSPQSWTLTGNFNLDPNQQWAPPQSELRPHVMMAYLHGEFNSYFAGQQVPAVKEGEEILNEIQLSSADQDRVTVASNSNAHLVVVGDSDFLTAQNAAPGNVAWILNTVDWLTLDNNLIGVRTRSLKDRSIRKDQLQSGSSMPTIVRTINIVIMPVLLIVLGLILYFKRKESAAISGTASRPDAKGAGENK